MHGQQGSWCDWHQELFQRGTECCFLHFCCSEFDACLRPLEAWNRLVNPLPFANPRIKSRILIPKSIKGRNWSPSLVGCSFKPGNTAIAFWCFVSCFLYLPLCHRKSLWFILELIGCACVRVYKICHPCLPFSTLQTTFDACITTEISTRGSLALTPRPVSAAPWQPGTSGPRLQAGDAPSLTSGYGSNKAEMLEGSAGYVSDGDILGKSVRMDSTTSGWVCVWIKHHNWLLEELCMGSMTSCKIFSFFKKKNKKQSNKLFTCFTDYSQCKLLF